MANLLRVSAFPGCWRRAAMWWPSATSMPKRCTGQRRCAPKRGPTMMHMRCWKRNRSTCSIPSCQLLREPMLKSLLPSAAYTSLAKSRRCSIWRWAGVLNRPLPTGASFQLWVCVSAIGRSFRRQKSGSRTNELCTCVFKALAACRAACMVVGGMRSINRVGARWTGVCTRRTICAL